MASEDGRQLDARIVRSCCNGTHVVPDRESILSILALAALVLALIALSRTGKGGDLAVRVKQLEDEVQRLRAALARGVSPDVLAALDGDAIEASDADVLAAESEAGQGEDAARSDDAFAPADAAGAPERASERVSQGPFVAPPSDATAASGAGVADARPSRDADAAHDADPTRGGAFDRLPPPGAPPPPPPAEPAPSLLSQVDWEQWLGVRGAAVLGGAALALAGLFFFRYSIEHGLIPPWLRVVLGVLSGAAAIAAAEWSLRRRYAGTANALAGGGLVILYAAFWAAGTLYELIPMGAVFVLMVLVTVAGCALSYRHESLVIAVIGLVGGFLTPVFASRGSDSPIGLFGYVLLLDVGLLLLARRMRWPLLGLLALAGTTIYQLLWIGGRMDADRVLLGLAILAVFALLFALATPRDADASAEGSSAWRWSQRGGVLLPLVTAIYFAIDADLRTGILPLGALLAILGLAAGFLAYRHGESLLATGAAAATLGVVLMWVLENDALGGTPWIAALVFVVLAAVHHLPLELVRSSVVGARAEAADADAEPGAAPASAPDAAPASRLGAVAARLPVLTDGAAVLGLGLLALLVLVGAFGALAPWPLVVGWLGIATVLIRRGTFAGRFRQQIASAAGVACGLALYRLNDGGEVVPSHGTVLLLSVMLAMVWQGIAILQSGRASHGTAERAAATFALVLLLGLMVDPPAGRLAGLALPALLGVLILLAATRAGGGPWLVTGTLVTALVQLAWTMEHHPLPPEASSLGALLLQLATAAAVTLWPVLAAQRLREDRWAWRGAALAGLAWLPSCGTLFEQRFGDAAIGVVPLVLAVLPVAAAARARDLWPAADPRRTSALAWLCGAALALVTIAIPLQVEKEWITIGWALEGAAMLVLWSRLDHAGLKYVALALLLAATVRLVGNPEVLVYYPRPAWRIVNWLAYAYLVPAAALVMAARTLAALEVERLRGWERPFYFGDRPLAAGACGLAALLVVFVWINLAIADWFSPADELRLLAAQTAAEKLVLSIAWALYAVLLLALGVRLRSVSLRWASLVLLMITIGKIFLYDVGELTDLYRVGALLGLALSLIVVSLVYQRFVFRKDETREA